MKAGKLSNQQLDELIFQKLNNKRTETVTGPGVGKDCALADLGDNYLVISADPITGTDKGIGKLCVNICCNDVAAAGGEPVGMLVTMLIPTNGTMRQIETIVDDVIGACAENQIDLIGGHTEISSAVNRFVLSGVCVGKKKKTPFKAVRSGDQLVMSKTAGLEGTGILAAEKEQELRGLLTDAQMSAAKACLDKTSVIKEGIIGEACGAVMMHDATEGGVLGAAWEMADNAKLGIRIFKSNIPVMEETKIICEHFAIDALRLISSGVMLFAVEDGAKLIEELQKSGIQAALIGEFTHNDKLLIDGDTGFQLQAPESDELFKVLQ